VKKSLAFWCADSLSKRLFVLLWGTLILSHGLGYYLATQVGATKGEGAWASPPVSTRMLLTPGLPPGFLGLGRPGGIGGPPARPAEGMLGGPPDGLELEGIPGGPVGFGAPRGPGGGPGGPMDGNGPPWLWLDYLVRVLVMGMAAWLGARWLTAPLRKLTQASQDLGDSLGRARELPLLDETTGPQEVRQTAHVFNDMARRLQDQFEQRSLMMAAVSHDLRTPLTRLRLRLERLQPDVVAERCAADVHEINDMIASVLDALHEERSQQPVQPVDMLALVMAMTDDMAEEGQPVTADGEQVTIEVQLVAVKRVLSNLISNALRYGKSAHVTVAREGREAVIQVTDQGPGIPESQLEAVFKPFFRLETSRNRETGGVGMGLYIARELVLRNGGELTLRNGRYGGLLAELRFPLACR
jgi:signal transduction histidine kinase